MLVLDTREVLPAVQGFLGLDGPDDEDVGHDGHVAHDFQLAPFTGPHGSEAAGTAALSPLQGVPGAPDVGDVDDAFVDVDVVGVDVSEEDALVAGDGDGDVPFRDLIAGGELGGELGHWITPDVGCRGTRGFV